MVRSTSTHYKPAGAGINAGSQALTLGVVGHVDHGKTALVRALTGIETDRLREERERGLSIVLGFSYLELGAAIVDFIDVPGHEDFVRAMISGATGLDGVVLVVAANEGIMPQTREHFDIVRLLGVDRGLVVITKADLVSADAIAGLRWELESYLHGSFLEDADFIEASCVTGQGVDALRRALETLRAEPLKRRAEAGCFLPLDRVFTMKGFGVVGTGTLRAGPMTAGERIEILPAGKAAAIRGLQSHNLNVERASPGERVAVNLRGIDRDTIRRGDTLATPGLLVPTRRIDVELQMLPHAGCEVKNGSSVRFLVGTSEAMAKLRLLGAQALAPGEHGLVQLRLDRDVATHKTERFLIRSVSPTRTIGGGRILDVNPQRHRRFDARVRRRLESTAGGDAVAFVRARLAEAGVAGVSLADLAREAGIGAEALRDELDASEYVGVTRDRLVSAGSLSQLRESTVAAIEAFHAGSPGSRGMPLASLADRLEPAPDPDVLRHCIDELCTHGRLAHEDGLVRLAGFDPFGNLNDADRRRAEAIEARFESAGLEAPSAAAVAGRRDKELLGLLLEIGRLVRLRTYDRGTELVLHASTLSEAQRRIADAFPYPSQFALKDVRDLLQSTRKYVVPLMEHFDATGVTIRMGDKRRLRTP